MAGHGGLSCEMWSKVVCEFLIKGTESQDGAGQVHACHVLNADEVMVPPSATEEVSYLLLALVGVGPSKLTSHVRMAAIIALLERDSQPFWLKLSVCVCKGPLQTLRQMRTSRYGARKTVA